MNRELLHFSHANGFPAACYRKFFAHLEPRYRIGSINCIGHDGAYPVTDSWPHLVAQLVDHLVAHYRHPVIGVGHSLGGYLTFMAAVQRPELFKCIVLLDAPIIGPYTGRAFGMLKRLGWVDRLTPAHATRERRRDWPSVEDMIAHFRRRKIFRHFDPDCLRDYALLGTRLEHGRRRLLFDPEIEYQIYRSVPHDLVHYCGRLKLPAGFVGGRDSDVLRRVGLVHTRKHFRVVRVEGGHLFPLEKPEAAAQAVAALAGELLAAR